MQSQELSLPFNGTVKKLYFKENVTIPKGEILLLTENELSQTQPIYTPNDCTIQHIFKQEKDQFRAGENIMTLQFCTHPVIFNDLCTNCGADLLGMQYKRTASLSIFHQTSSLKVGVDVAEKQGREKEEKLIEEEKLILLLDIDHTLIHAVKSDSYFHFQISNLKLEDLEYKNRNKSPVSPPFPPPSPSPSPSSSLPLPTDDHSNPDPLLVTLIPPQPSSSPSPSTSTSPSLVCNSITTQSESALPSPSNEALREVNSTENTKLNIPEECSNDIKKDKAAAEEGNITTTTLIISDIGESETSPSTLGRLEKDRSTGSTLECDPMDILSNKENSSSQTRLEAVSMHAEPTIGSGAAGSEEKGNTKSGDSKNTNEQEKVEIHQINADKIEEIRAKERQRVLEGLFDFTITTQKKKEHFYIKLRPGLKNFLKDLSEFYEIHLFTHGNRPYAENIKKILDKKEIYFKNRLITRDEMVDKSQQTSSHAIPPKSVSRLFPFTKRFVAIVDDLFHVWEKDVERVYKIFPFSFFIPNSSLNPAHRHSHIHSNWYSSGSLNETHLHYAKLQLLSLHKQFFESPNINTIDISTILSSQRARVLNGVHILFSAIFLKTSNPSDEKLWKLACLFGARCYSSMNDKITHVITAVKDTDKAKEGKKRGCKVVHISWLMDCLRDWYHFPEDSYLAATIPIYDHNKLLKEVNSEASQLHTCYGSLNAIASKQVVASDFDFGSESEESGDETSSFASSGEENMSDNDEPPTKKRKNF